MEGPGFYGQGFGGSMDYERARRSAIEVEPPKERAEARQSRRSRRQRNPVYGRDSNKAEWGLQMHRQGQCRWHRRGSCGIRVDGMSFREGAP